MTGSSSEIAFVIAFVHYTTTDGSSFENFPRRAPDLSRLRKLIGYAPRASLDDILRAIVDHAATP